MTTNTLRRALCASALIALFTGCTGPASSPIAPVNNPTPVATASPSPTPSPTPVASASPVG